VKKSIHITPVILTLSFISYIFSITPVAANEIEDKFIAAGLVDISQIDNSIRVNLVNSNPKKNFFRESYYNVLNKAYLRESVAQKLSTAQKILKEKKPYYSLQILDAARPRSVSKLMYERMKGTRFEKYVANPVKGSMHNYGIAVDITIVDKDGKEIDMGLSPFNKNDIEIYWQYAKMKMGFKLSEKQKKNRKLLSGVMQAAGFFPLSYEWWHFNGMKKDEVRRNYSIIE
jgi:D-alanyl-D-alanine dipeptidase